MEPLLLATLLAVAPGPRHNLIVVRPEHRRCWKKVVGGAVLAGAVVAIVSFNDDQDHYVVRVVTKDCHDD